MQKIKFNNSDRIFEVSLSTYEKGRIKCVFHTDIDIRNSPFLKSGFRELNEKNLRVQGNHSKMKYLYQQLNDNTIIFTSDPDDNYQNGQETICTNADPEPISTEEIRNNKLVELSQKCHTAIIDGVVVIVNGAAEHFTYDEKEQQNIKDLYDLAVSTDSPVYYHAENMDYEEYSADQMSEIYRRLTKNKMHHMIYYNQLKMYVASLNTPEEIEKVYYGQKLSGKYLEVYQDALQQNTAHF